MYKFIELKHCESTAGLLISQHLIVMHHQYQNDFHLIHTASRDQRFFFTFLKFQQNISPCDYKLSKTNQGTAENNNVTNFI